MISRIPSSPEAHSRALHFSGPHCLRASIVRTNACGILGLAFLLVFVVFQFAAPARGETVTFTGAGGDNNWSDSNNWTPQPFPNSASDNVLISGTIVTLDVSVTTGSMTLNTAAIDMEAGTNLAIAGNLNGYGEIVVNSQQSSAATALNFSGGTVSGSGGILLDFVGSNAEITGSLIQGAGHTIFGFGEINATLTNNGIVNATAGGQTLALESGGMTNNNVMESSNAAVLDINGTTLGQGANGELLTNGGNIQFENNTTITGGLLKSSTNGGLFVLNGGAAATFNTLSNYATVDMAAGSVLNVTGTVADYGEIVVNSGQNAAGTAVNFSGGKITGTGAIILNYPGANAQLNGTLTQGVGHTISGFGEINAALGNNGIVNADVSGQTLTLESSKMINDNIMEASAGGSLDISGIAITQGGIGQLLANGGNVQFDGGATVNGGVLNSSTSTSVFIVDSAAATFNTVTNNATVNLLAGTALNVSGTLTDNGAIVVNSGQNAATTVVNFSGGSVVSGSGAIILNYAGGNAQLNGTLTQAASHTISGFGQINAALTNYGVVNASNGYSNTLTLQNSAMTNDNLMEATNSGLLDINGITVTQGTGGQLYANGGNVQFDGGATVIGGALNSSTSGSLFIVASGATFQSLTNNATVNILVGNTLNVTGSLNDNGAIVVNSGQNAATTVVNFSGGSVVSGSGAIILNCAGGNAQLTGTLTQEASHTISGFGQINAALTNYGVVNASNVFNNTLTLQNSAMTNDNLMEATGGGLLDINGITVTQGTGGQLYANGGNVQFDGGATVIGGALNSSTSGSLFIVASGATFQSLTNNATVNILAGNTLNVTGSLNDNGAIVVNSGQNAATTVVNFSGGSVVSGSGAIILNYPGANAQLTGTLTQQASHTISGFGQINAALTNYGVVNASNVYNNTLTLQNSAMTNDNLMEATGGGLLDINGITVTQGTGGQLYANGGNVQFDGGATVNGGTLNSSTSGSVFIVASGATFHSLTNNATVNILAENTLNVTGSLNDNGAIVVNSGQNAAGTIVNFSGGSVVSGSGAIILNYPGATAQLTGTLTQGASHTISGFGQINAALTNYGVVNASNGFSNTLTLQNSAMTNDNLMEATNNGLLDINGITVTQGTGGQLYANGGNVQFDGGATVNGGTLNSSTSGSVFIVASGATFHSLTNNATVNILAENTLNVTGSLNDNGAIVVNSGRNAASTIVNFSGGSVVSGSGAIILNYPGATAQLNGTLTQGASHTISGFGEINATLANFGTVNANYGGQTLYVTGTTSNKGLMKASDGGTLSFSAGVLANLSGSTLTGGTFEALASSAITLPGSITTNAATVILNGPASSFSAINSLAANNGTFEVLGGQSFTTPGALADYGAVTVGGASSLVSVNGEFAESGSGALAVTGGGALSDSIGSVGNAAGSNSAAAVSGSGSQWTNTGNLYVGYSGTGSLGITGGAGVLTDGASYLGYAAKSNGLATVSGSASDWQTIGNLAVGYSGAGTLTISGGGDVSDHQSYIGYSAGSDGTVTVTGAGSEWSTTGNLAIGSSGTGTLIVENGGTVAVTGAITVGSAGTLEIGSTISAASATINGGTVITLVPLATAAGATFGTGGVNLNTDGLNSTFTGNFSGTGGLTKSGSGAATFEGASTYTGPTVVNSGTLALTTGATRTASLGNTAISVASGATFAANVAASPFSQVVNAGTTGGGAAGASLTLNPGSTFSMDGPSLATFNLQQQTSFAGPAFTIGGVFGLAPTLIFDIGNAATGTDLLNVTGTVSVLATGGDIAIAALAGDTSLTSGSYNLITTAGGFSGTNGNGLVLSGTTLVLSGTTYDLSLANSTTDDEVLTVSDAPVGPYADLAGQTSSGKTPGPQPLFVPEPGTDSSLLLALGLGAAVWLLRRRDAAKSAKRT